MKLLVFQHIACEHPGILRSFLAADDIQWDAVELDAGEPIPALDDYDALWVMGGPMDVWDVAEHPWMVAEKKAIRTWVQDLEKPFLGFCLGHQLLADALGGTCGPLRPPEIGIMEIELTKKGLNDPIFAGMPRVQKCLQWHSVAVAQPPEGATVLAKSEGCTVQALRFGDQAWSMQYHVELEPDTIENWGKVPAYRTALEASVGPGALDNMQRDADRDMEGFVENAHILYRNFMNLART